MTSRTTSRTRTWPAWSGDIDALRSIARVITDVAADRHRELVEIARAEVAAAQNKVAEPEANRTDSLPGPEPVQTTIDIVRAEVKRIVQGSSLAAINYQHALEKLERMERVERQDLVELIVLDKYEQTRGRIDDVLDELDRRSTFKVTFITRRPWQFLLSEDPTFISPYDGDFIPQDGTRVVLGGDRTETIHVSVASTSTGWARSAFTRICDEIEKGVPKWAFVRSHSIFVGIASVAILLTALGIAIDLSTDFLLIILPAGILLGGVLTVTDTFTRLMNWLLPPFEITSRDSPPSGTRRLWALLSVVISIPVGILVNLIS